jgi:hypothetical protein
MNFSRVWKGALFAAPLLFVAASARADWWFSDAKCDVCESPGGKNLCGVDKTGSFCHLRGDLSACEDSC